MRNGAEQEPRTPRTPMTSTIPTTPRTRFGSETPRTSVSASDTETLLLSSPPVKGKATRLDAKAAVFVPTFKLPTPESPGKTDDAPAPATAEVDTKGATSSSTGRSTPYDDPTSEYVRLKMQITDLTSHRRQPGENGDAKFLRDLQKRLEEVRQDYFFDERDAEDAFKAERRKADEALLQAKLRGDIPLAEPEVAKDKPKKKPAKTPAAVPPPQTPSPDIFDDDSDKDGGAGGMFDILQPPADEVTPQGTTVHVRDMALPKNWSGRTPKQLLKETVHKLDRHAVITYNCVSGASRAQRSSVSIRWEWRKNGDWTMEDIACHDLAQAEQYISTVALHALTFPESEGFALGGTAAASSQTSFRVLPPIYRDLWNELEEKRRSGDDVINRNVWAKLKSLLEPKLSLVKVQCSLNDLKALILIYTQSGSKGIKEATNIAHTSALRLANQSELTPDQIMAGFAIRQNSLAYQEMLVSRFLVWHKALSLTMIW